jgi:hypothetical protein
VFDTYLLAFSASRQGRPDFDHLQFHNRSREIPLEKQKKIKKTVETPLDDLRTRCDQTSRKLWVFCKDLVAIVGPRLLTASDEDVWALKVENVQAVGETAHVEMAR